MVQSKVAVVIDLLIVFEMQFSSVLTEMKGENIKLNLKVFAVVIYKLLFTFHNLTLTQE